MTRDIPLRRLPPPQLRGVTAEDRIGYCDVDQPGFLRFLHTLL